MSSTSHRRKCRCCNLFFTPDRHNPRRQFYCAAPDCRRASKAASQQRWLRQPANRDYFRGAANVERVRQWRHTHPGYWKRATSRSNQGQPAAGKALNSETTSCNAPRPAPVALQDFVLTEHPAFVGLIALVTGRTLQEDIAAVGRHLLLQGKNILGLRDPQPISSSHDSKTSDSSRAPAPGAAPF
jgi:hypothetical protein